MSLTREKSYMISHGNDTVEGILNAVRLIDYSSLRIYSGLQTSVYITKKGTSGYFIRDDSDTTSVDNGGTVIVAANGKRWKRQYEGAQAVQWFGVKGDGVTNDTAAILNAIAAVKQTGGGVLRFEPGKRYKIDNTITIPSGVTLKGGDQIISTEFLVAGTSYCGLPIFDIYTPNPSPAFIVSTSSGIIGFAFNYPGQVGSTSSTPIQFGWTIATDTTLPGNTDNVVLQNLLLINPYLGINLDRAGRFALDYVYGQPIKKGIFIDRVYDASRMAHVHFWTFYAALDTALGQWVTTNGRAIEINRIDGLAAYDILTLGYQDGLWFSDVGQGSAWADFTSSNFDGCLRPITFQKVQKVTFTGGSATSLNAVYPIIRTVGNIDGQVTFNGVKLYGVSNTGALIRSTTGTFQFFSCVIPSISSNGPGGVAVINESTCKVMISDCDLGGNRIYGGETTFINGIPLLPCNSPVSLTTNPNTPSNWAGSLVASSVAGGVQFAVTSSVAMADYTLGNEVRAPGLYVLEFDAECPADSGMYVRIHLCGSSGDGNFAEVYLSTVGIQNYNDVSMDGTSKAHIRFPFFSGHYIEPSVLRVEAHTYSAGVNRALILKNISFHKPDPTTLKDSSAQLVQGGVFSEPVFSVNVTRNMYSNLQLKNIAGAPSYDSTPLGNQVLYGIQAPTIGTWRMGDRVVNSRPAVGQPKAWVCTIGGTPGTWVSEGTL